MEDGSRALRLASPWKCGTFVLLLHLLLSAGVCGSAFGQSGNSSWDIGAAAGVTSYTGDFNLTALPRSAHGTGGLLVRYELSERYSLRLGVDVAGSRGSYDSLRYVLPEVPHGAAFSRLTLGLDLAAEIHFLSFQVNDFATRGKPTSPWTPYASLGMGVYYMIGGGVTFGLPLGGGVKVALGDRLTLATEVRFVKLFSDWLEGYDNWPGSRNYSVFHNKDWIGQVRLALTYRLLTGWKTCPTYMSDNEKAIY